MRALVCEDNIPRILATRVLSLVTPRALVGPTAPMQLREVPDPVLPAHDWLVVRTNLCGLCGSDYKQVFLKGSLDNPMTSLVSWPQILGHEVVGVIDEVGPAVKERFVGERVLLNPWLSCAPRGLPLCEWCQQGDLAQCLNFTRGSIPTGIHTGNSSAATGGQAARLPAHASQWFPIPDEISDEAAVLADPFAVSLHAILHTPPTDSGMALVYGCGTLGLLAIAILRLLYPRVRVLAVARFDHQADLARKFGAERIIRHHPTKRLVTEIAEAANADLLEPWYGLPMLNGGVDVIYDTVSAPETFEVGVRVTRSRGSIVAIGVESPRRFEWTPLYFKEISLVGSNGFGIEEWEGRRQHAMLWYLEFIHAKQLDVTPIITHRFPLTAYRDAFLTCYDQERHKAVKVLFDNFE